jgi:hypothetical protein
MLDTPAHPQLAFALDIADKLIKLAAVLLGGVWTYWNYRKSRTYQQKLELEVVGTVFTRGDLYCDVKLTVKNIGNTRHNVEHEGTFCELSVVHADLSEESLELFDVFTEEDSLEPGESMKDALYWSVPAAADSIVWVKLTLRVVSNGVQWSSTDLIRMGVSP